MTLIQMFQYGFIQRALIAGSLIAVLCAVLGVFLVLRRLSLIGDGLAHVTFGSVALALCVNIPPLAVTLAAIPLVMLSSLGILKLMERARIFGDAAVGIVASLGIAVGVLLAGLSGGFSVDLFSYLFGNILSVSREEVILAAILFVLIIAAVSLYYYELLAVTFDEELARTSGINTGRVNTLLVLLTSLIVVLAMKVAGIMLVSSLIVLPAVTALQVATGFRTALFLAAACALLSVVTGIIASFACNIPAGATIILLNFGLFLCAFLGRRFIRQER
jgi:zinc transport system permease protein